MEKTKNKKIIYILAVIVIIIGIIVTYVWKTNVSLEFLAHTRIDLYIGKNYHIEEIRQISREVFGEQKTYEQKIETFNDSIAIHVKEATKEQLETLESKVKEKYEIEDTNNNLVQTIQMGNVRIRDMVKPYMIPMIVTTLIILAYVGIRYLNLGIFKVVFTVLLHMILAEGVTLSIFQIIRIPVGNYTIPVVIAVYLLVTIITVLGYEKILARKKAEDSKK